MLNDEIQIIMLTSLEDMESFEICFELVANDYVSLKDKNEELENLHTKLEEPQLKLIPKVNPESQ